MFQVVKNVVFCLIITALCFLAIGLQTGLIKPPARKPKPNTPSTVHELDRHVDAIRQEVGKIRAELRKAHEELEKLRESSTSEKGTDSIEKIEYELSQLSEYSNKIILRHPVSPARHFIDLFR
jgi:hypothetical protein